MKRTYRISLKVREEDKNYLIGVCEDENLAHKAACILDSIYGNSYEQIKETKKFENIEEFKRLLAEHMLKENHSSNEIKFLKEIGNF